MWNPPEECDPHDILREGIADIATLVGLLVINDRTEEALLVRDRALNDFDDPEFRATLEAALTGHLPKQPG
jgi:hypothetical protein